MFIQGVIAMQSQKCSLGLYVDFLIASQKQYSGVEFSKVSPTDIAHDAVSRWLSKNKLTPKIVWQHAAPMVNPHTGYLIIDDTVLDKPYAKNMDLVKPQYSGKHHRVVNGIDSVNMLWTDEEKIIPVDYRVYDLTRDGKTKNDHAQEMLKFVEKRGFSPEYVLLDSWYSSINNLKAISKKGWKWMAEIKSNRQVSVVQGTYRAVSDLDWTSTQVHKVWLKAYGFVRVSMTVFENGDSTYIATNDMSLTEEETIRSHAEHRWKIETFHRGIKQCCGIERCYSTLERSQRNHILCAFLAFLKLEWQRIKYGFSWYEQKWSIPRTAISSYLANA
jgi:SRSO17 transposase